MYLYAPRLLYPYGIYMLKINSIYSNTAHKSDYTTVSSELCDDLATRSAMWPSVAGESCESREAWAASL